MSPAGDLAGVTVISVEQAVAAPYASCRLADAGARVIKVERPEGDFARRYDRFVKDQSAYFVWLNRGKESICLDLKRADDRALLQRMATRADVFIQNLKPGLLARMGLGAQALRAGNDRLITCDITGFGLEGPAANLKAYDLIVQAECGLCAITGDPQTPARVGVSVCDIAAGMTAHAAILQALLARTRTGRGRTISVSLFDSIADWMNVPLLQFQYGGHVAARAGVNHPTLAPYGAYVCGDGTRLIFSVQNDPEWARLCETVLAAAALAEDPRFHDNMARLENRAALDEVIAARFAELSAPQAMALLECAEIAYGRLNSVPEAAAHPHLRFVSIETPEGDIRVIAPAAIMDGGVVSFGRVPALGADSSSLRMEFA
jgi:crotonobetainyl-CoA:carnitine CoA-transferase CaiB-like acyl-CoA transferase